MVETSHNPVLSHGMEIDRMSSPSVYLKSILMFMRHLSRINLNASSWDKVTRCTEEHHILSSHQSFGSIWMVCLASLLYPSIFILVCLTNCTTGSFGIHGRASQAIGKLSMWPRSCIFSIQTNGDKYLQHFLTRKHWVFPLVGPLPSRAPFLSVFSSCCPHGARTNHDTPTFILILAWF